MSEGICRLQSSILAAGAAAPGPLGTPGVFVAAGQPVRAPFLYSRAGRPRRYALLRVVTFPMGKWRDAAAPS